MSCCSLTTVSADGPFNLCEYFTGWHFLGLVGVIERFRWGTTVVLLPADPGEDGTDGFFVAVFERRPDVESAATTAVQAPNGQEQTQPEKKMKRRKGS